MLSDNAEPRRRGLRQRISLVVPGNQTYEFFETGGAGRARNLESGWEVLGSGG